MDRERAETYLYLLAEAESRRAAALPPAPAGVLAAAIHRDAQARDFGRVRRIAQLLVTLGGLGAEVAGQVVDEFELALSVRRPGSLSAHRLSRYPLRPPSSPEPRTAPDYAVPSGQLIAVRSERDAGQLRLLSYAHTDSGVLLTLVAESGSFGQMRLEEDWDPRWPPGNRPWRQVIPPFRQFSATDEMGASYEVVSRGHGHHRGEWTVALYPHPPRDLPWLNLHTTPGEPAVRIDLSRPVARTEVMVREVALSPGEQILHQVATRLLTAAPRSPGSLGDVVEGLDQVLAALRACDALSPASPVPGQFVGLCARLNVTGHGITAPPARDLPGPWLSLLAYHQRPKPRAAPRHVGCVAVAAALPELDGFRLTIVGLRNGRDGTILQMHVGHAAPLSYYDQAQVNVAPVIWLRDDGGRWHAARVLRRGEGDDTMRLRVVPPLSRATRSVEVLVAGRTAEVRTELPLSWHLLFARTTSHLHPWSSPRPAWEEISCM